MSEPTVIPNQSDAAANAANIAAIESAAGHSRFRHIVAWGKFLGFTPATVCREVERAEAENAPVNAIQKFDDGWHTVDDILNPTNRERVEKLARPGT
jgi:hypothetical protein